MENIIFSSADTPRKPHFPMVKVSHSRLQHVEKKELGGG